LKQKGKPEISPGGRKRIGEKTKKKPPILY